MANNTGVEDRLTLIEDRLTLIEDVLHPRPVKERVSIALKSVLQKQNDLFLDATIIGNNPNVVRQSKDEIIERMTPSRGKNLNPQFDEVRTNCMDTIKTELEMYKKYPNNYSLYIEYIDKTDGLNVMPTGIKILNGQELFVSDSSVFLNFDIHTCPPPELNGFFKPIDYVIPVILIAIAKNNTRFKEIQDRYSNSGYWLNADEKAGGYKRTRRTKRNKRNTQKRFKRK